MSRISSAAQPRTLTLTEELEKLEQSITLTLQEIDHNFSRAHRIVTSSILPVVEQYATHSKEVWEGSKFWKQFFESSANVSLSGYEEQPSQHESTENTMTEESNATTNETSQSYETPSAQHISTDSIQDLDLSNLTVSPSHSTPRPSKPAQATFADYPSPYEALRQEVNSTTVDATSITQTMPGTPGRAFFPVDTIAQTPESSPFLPPPPTSIPRPSPQRIKTDPLLHRVLDRNYRVQATPMTGNRFANRSKAAETPLTAKRAADPTLSSSPEMAPPQLHAEIFSSPERKTRLPGVSVLTPGKNKIKAPSRTPGIWDSDEDESDDDIAFGSPPKTMQFHVPQNRLMQTPAKEASKRIVEDILTNAGVDYDDDEIDFEHEIETQGFDLEDATSPSVVRKAADIEDETF
ncbi:DASH complex subunit ask1 [Elasticomyces elasticus]|uniref:DASH complex subunit ASK1 n=1 Tax=Exophiala sideris TaxID=1016849 RepID=A0ABR0JQ12_9EURO|nr:DASH complex subunit ask1 [Elasticomyces elasticus]KAK5039688.1 DASH complex subunit ask1 [Exophiala sideris]KAK5041240.1 DASH complex subunit ask1 [Exophiala sideris]KAK5068065.1 DASH complex subunit ask1 [Exophiala sideris]KAK5187367.1 DASH complex subunit ask1 [Eurotiomycetes sp. CCFEE 6388]